MEKEEQEGIQVRDRRRFSEEETKAEPSGPPKGAARPEGGRKDTGPSAGPEKKTRPEETGGPLPEASFSTFVLGLSAQALMYLGEVPDPQAGTAQADLPAAKQMIDILGILKDKTGGNLDATESRLLDNVLFDLRMKYVERTK